MNPTRRSVIAAGAAGVAALAAGCSGGGSGGGTVAGDGRLRISVWTANKDHLALLNSIGEAFRADRPEVRSVTFESLNPADYTTALTTQLASGNPPDLGWILETTAADFIEAETLVDMAPDMKADGDYRYNDLEPALLNQWRRGTSLYAYPFSSSPFAVFYNADVLAKAGAADPAELAADGAWTWDALAEAAKKVTDAKAARFGLVIHEFEYKQWDRLYPIMGAYGARPWTPDNDCGFSDPRMTDAIDFLRDMAFTDRSTPAPGEQADFFSGESAMVIFQVSKIGPLADVQWKWGAVPLPSGPAGDRQVIGQAGLGVFAKGRNLDLAKEFFLYSTNTENAAKLARFFPPPRASLLTSDTLAETNPLLSKDQLQKVIIDSLKSGTVRPGHTGYAQLSEQARAGLDAAWKPKADTRKVLRDLCTSIQPILRTGS